MSKYANRDGSAVNMSEKQESQTIEWKWSWQDEFLKWLCGYANTDGGILYIGVNDDGYVVGVENIREMLERLPNKINDKLGIIASIQNHSTYGAENIRYGDAVPKKNRIEADKSVCLRTDQFFYGGRDRQET